MKKGHRPIRMCILCRERYLKEQLMRLSLKDYKVVIDGDKKMPGRGAYVCGKCLKLVKNNYRGCLNRAFKTNSKLVWE